MAHESMRLCLIGPQSPLWRRRHEAACILAASVPSGAADVRLLRNQLVSLRLGPGFVQGLRTPPVVSHAFVDFNCTTALPASHIFVGACTNNRLSSPWLDPAALGAFPFESFECYARSRADLMQWLSYLDACTLVCDYSLGDKCHALCLQRLFIEHLDEGAAADATGIDNVSSPEHGQGSCQTVGDYLDGLGFQPSGRTSTATVGIRASAASQPIG